MGRIYFLRTRLFALILTPLVLMAIVPVVWFRVECGPRTLVNLEEAIEARSPTDFSIIKNAVPAETRGIVDTLNRLFAQVEARITTHQVFISGATHQLRNPAAAVQSMAVAARDTTTGEERVRRPDELVNDTHSAARVTEQLLSLDQLRHGGGEDRIVTFDLNQRVEDTCADLAPSVLVAGKDFEPDLPRRPLTVRGNRVLLSEALKNLVDNAMKHGGSDLSRISVGIALRSAMAEETIEEDGFGLSPELAELTFSRFSMVESSDGSGLRLAIALSVAELHGGTLRINAPDCRASFTIAVPATTAST